MRTVFALRSGNPDTQRQSDLGPDRCVPPHLRAEPGAAHPGQEPGHRAAGRHPQAVRLQALRHQLVPWNPRLGRDHGRSQREVNKKKSVMMLDDDICFESISKLGHYVSLKVETKNKRN